jgi:hypothetical protein
MKTDIHILHDITKCNIWLQEAAFPSALQRAHTSSIHRQLNKPRFVAGSRNCMSLCKTQAKQQSKAGQIIFFNCMHAFCKNTVNKYGD